MPHPQPLIRIVAPAIAAVILSAGAAFAQSPLSPTPMTGAPAASTPATSTPATPSEPTPAAVALARDVIVGSGISRSLDLIVPQFLDQIGTNLTQTRPDLIRDLNAVMEQIKPEFDKQTQDLISSAARLYAQRLTQAQLREVAGFFQSASGKAYVEAQPAMMTDLFTSMQAFSQRISADMMTRVRTEMKKRGHEL